MRWTIEPLESGPSFPRPFRLAQKLGMPQAATPSAFCLGGKTSCLARKGAYAATLLHRSPYAWTTPHQTGFSLLGRATWYRGGMRNYVWSIPSLVCPYRCDVSQLRAHTSWCDCPFDEPCVADVLIAEVFGEWIMSDTNQFSIFPTHPSVGWHGTALSILVATFGNVGKAASASIPHLAREPSVDWHLTPQWHQEAVIQEFKGHYPEGIVDGFAFPFIEGVVNTPAFRHLPLWRAEAAAKRHHAGCRSLCGPSWL